MTTRRTFLKGLGAGLILPTTWDMFSSHLENYGEPLLRRPQRVDDVLYLFHCGDDYRIALNKIDEEMPDPDMSIKEYASKFGDNKWHWDCDPDYEDRDENRAIGVWFVWDYWPYHCTSDARAYDFLDSLDLGWFDRGHDVNEGYVDFFWGVSPGNDSKFVNADLLGGSILQERLNERGYNVMVKLV